MNNNKYQELLSSFPQKGERNIGLIPFIQKARKCGIPDGKIKSDILSLPQCQGNDPLTEEEMDRAFSRINSSPQVIEAQIIPVKSSVIETPMPLYPISSVQERNSMEELKAQSPSSIYGDGRDTISFLQCLFNEGDHICIGGLKDVQAVALRDILASNKTIEGPYVGVNPFKPNSTRKDGNIAGFGNLVIEFDPPDGSNIEDEIARQVAFWLKMLELGLPIKSLTFSGNKSIHAILAIEVNSAEQWKTEIGKLYEIFAKMGADRANKNPGRLTRPPGVIRQDTGKLQDLLYLNPEVRPMKVNEIIKLLVPAEIVPDRRALTSPGNGRLGGRPSFEPMKYAQMFAKTFAPGEDLLGLRCYNGDWYIYNGKKWQLLAESDLRAKLMGFLQRAREEGIEDVYFPKDPGKNLAGDVEANLKSSELCVLTSDIYKAPCFISEPEKSLADTMVMENGILDILGAAEMLSTGEERLVLLNHTPDYFSTSAVDYNFDPAATCPLFDRFLSEIQPDEADREILQMLAGLSLIRDCRYNVAFFLFGEGGTGKSTFSDVLKALVGADNVCCISYGKLAEKFNLTPLTEKLLNVVQETPAFGEMTNRAEIEGRFKSCTAGEEIEVEQKFQTPRKARVTARFIFAMNELPYIGDKSDGIWDRLRIIPFVVRKRGTEEQDNNLTAKLLEELPGVLNWALRGLYKLRKLQMFPESEAGLRIKKEHRLGCDLEKDFLSQTVEVCEGAYIGTQALYDKYKDFAIANGRRSLGMQNFNAAVKRIYSNAFTERRVLNGFRAMVWINLTLTGVTG